MEHPSVIGASSTSEEQEHLWASEPLNVLNLLVIKKGKVWGYELLVLVLWVVAVDVYCQVH